MTFRAVVEKEVVDIIREKRFGGWAIAFVAFWTFILVVQLTQIERNLLHSREYPSSALDLAMVVYYVGAISLVVLALFNATDGIAKERESGMLPVVGATPVVRWQLPAAKLIAGFAAYAAAMLVALIPAGVIAFAQGTPLLWLTLASYMGPFLALYVFLLGVGLLLGILAKSSKVAIGAGAAFYFPVFLLGGMSPFQQLYAEYPLLRQIVSYTPFDATFKAFMTLAYGGVMPWGPLAATVGLGAACAAAAFWVFSRQEVAL